MGQERARGGVSGTITHCLPVPASQPAFSSTQMDGEEDRLGGVFPFSFLFARKALGKQVFISYICYVR